MDVRAIATQKLGPLPAWAWGGIAGGGALAFRLWRNRGTSSATADAATADVAVDDPGGVNRPDLLGGRDTAGFPATDTGWPSSGAPEPDASVPDWLAVPPSWYTDPPPPIVVEAPGSTLVDQPSPVVAPTSPAPSSRNPSSTATRDVGPWATKGQRDRAVAGAHVVRTFSNAKGYWATIAASSPAPAVPTPSTPVGGGHAAPAAPAPTTRDVGPWATAAARDKAVAGAQVVRKFSNGHGYFATIRS